jgi:hypothetical protein
MNNTRTTSVTETARSKKRKLASSLAVTLLLLSLLAVTVTSLQGSYSSDSQILMADGNNSGKPGGG